MANTDWPHLLADITAKRDALNQVIEVLTSHFIRDGATSTPTPAPRAKSGPKTASKRNERTNERAKAAPTGTRQRSLPDGTTKKTARHQEAILTALRAKSPQTPNALAQGLKLARSALTYQIKPLLKSGAVVATGATMNRQFSLPPRRAAKEAL